MTGDQGEPDDPLEAIRAATAIGVQGELGDPLEEIEASTVLDVLDIAAASTLASLRAVPVAAPAVRVPQGPALLGLQREPKADAERPRAAGPAAGGRRRG